MNAKGSMFILMHAWEWRCAWVHLKCSSSWQDQGVFNVKSHLIVGDHAGNKWQLWHIGVGSQGIEKIILAAEPLEQSITHSHAVNGHPMLSVCGSVYLCVSKTDRWSRQPACKDISFVCVYVCVSECVWRKIQYSYFLVSLSLRSPQSPTSNDIFLSQLHTVTQGDLCQYQHM